MPDPHLTLPADLHLKATQRARDNGYASLEAYVADLLRADTLPFKDPAIEKILLHRLSAPSAGPYTSADFDRLRQTLRSSPRL